MPLKFNPVTGDLVDETRRPVLNPQLGRASRSGCTTRRSAARQADIPERYGREEATPPTRR